MHHVKRKIYFDQKKKEKYTCMHFFIRTCMHECTYTTDIFVDFNIDIEGQQKN